MKTIIATLFLSIFAFTAGAQENIQGKTLRGNTPVIKKDYYRSSDAVFTDMEVHCQNQDGFNEYAVRVLGEYNATIAIYHMYASQTGILGTVPVYSDYTIEISRWTGSSEIFTASIVAWNYSDIIQNQSGPITFYDVDLHGILVISIY